MTENHVPAEADVPNQDLSSPAEADAPNQDFSSPAEADAARPRIRPLSAGAGPEVFLPFLDLCFNWSMDKPRIETPDLLERDDIGFYYRDWGRAGDIAVAAWDADADVDPGTRNDKDPGIIGLAWMRLATEDSTGYGWVAADIPELSIAVLPDHQARGIGGTLLEAACSLARMSGVQAISLSVEDGNSAAHLYQDRGFIPVGRNGDSDILVRQLG